MHLRLPSVPQVQRQPRVGYSRPSRNSNRVTSSALRTRGYGRLAKATHRPRDDKRDKVVILGSGWAEKYRILVVSPRPYFVFTPLLNDTAVGTLEFRNVLESVRTRNGSVEFLQGWADDVNLLDKSIMVEPSVLDPDVGHALRGPRKPNGQQTSIGFSKEVQLGGTGETQVATFPVQYDKLIIAVGCYSQTFNTKGVRENAMFLKDVGDAVAIRKRILELFELAKLPIISEETRSYLLHFAIVGGGPTGMEFAACLSDLVRDDISQLHPELIKHIRITLYDVAPKVLPMFDASLADYAVKQYKRQNVQIKTSHHVEELRKGSPNDSQTAHNQDRQAKGRVYTIRTKEDGDLGIGMCVWSTGNMNNPFVARALDHVHRFPPRSAHIVQCEIKDPDQRQWIIERDPKTGVILVDDHFRVNIITEAKAEGEENAPHAYVKDVFALGDVTKLKAGPLPATAQVANQQALWLGNMLNKYPSSEEYARVAGFQFKNLGVLTYVGGAKAVFQGASIGRNGMAHGIKGWVAFLIWRGAYLTMTLSWRNKLLVPIQWLAVKLFGRDTSRY